MRVSKNVFTFLFLITGLISLWIGGKFFYHLYGYFTLSEAQKVEISSWNVEEVRPGEFALIANYSFENNGATYRKEFQFSKPMYTNPHKAQDHIDEWKQQQWWVWYSAKDPHNSSLQKMFPFKASIHFILCLAVLLYFFWLKFYVTRIHSGVT